MSLKFIHCADLHIDSPMRGLGTSDVDGESAKRIRETTRAAFEELVDRALSEKVAFVVVAGDLFDGDWDDLQTGLWTIRQFKRLEAEKIPVFVAFGNHDRQNKTLRSLSFPKNVKIFSEKAPETFLFPDDLPQLFSDPPQAESERVALTGQSYSGPTCPENLAANYPDATPNAFNVGVLHTDLGGDGAKSSYAPTGIETLNSKRYDYWALGHVHQRRTEQTTPCWIGYSGVLQGRHIRETDPKGFYLVEIDGGKLVGPEPTFIPADSLRWFALEIDLSGVATEDEFQSKFIKSLKQTIDGADGRFAAVRVSLVGRTELHRDLAKRRANNGTGTFSETLSGMLRSWASADEVWLEEIKLETAPPRDLPPLPGDLAAEFDRKIDRLTAAISGDSDAPAPKDETLEDEALLAALRKRAAMFLEKLEIDLSDPATLLRWNEEARKILTETFADAAD